MSETALATKPRLALHKGSPLERTAATADRFELYRLSVQDPAADARLLARFYTQATGKLARVLREDFCGTFAVCCEWAKSHPERVAYGLDLDTETLNWGRVHHFNALDEGQRKRVHAIEGDVRTPGLTPPADIVFAGNFSYYLFKTRDTLRDYFKAAHAAMADDGVFVIDMMGGTEAFEDDFDCPRRVKDFTYVWEHETFDPVTHNGVFHIHFRFRDKTEMTRAFSYDWRVWTMPEVRELLVEAGFTSTTIYADTESGFKVRERLDADASWIAFLVSTKG